MIPTRWSSAIAILRRRTSEEAAAKRVLRARSRTTTGRECGRDDARTEPEGNADERAITARLVALWKQLTGG